MADSAARRPAWRADTYRVSQRRRVSANDDSACSLSGGLIRARGARGARGRRARRVGLLLGLLRVALVGPRGGGLGVLAPALGGAVVGVVEARALEVHGDRVEDALDRRPAHLALSHRLLRDLLHHLE